MSHDYTHQVISTLRANYDLSTHVVQTVTMNDLYGKQCNKDLEVNKHIDYMIDTHARLAEAGMTIADDHFINALKGSLPKA